MCQYFFSVARTFIVCGTSLFKFMSRVFPWLAWSVTYNPFHCFPFFSILFQNQSFWGKSKFFVLRVKMVKWLGEDRKGSPTLMVGGRLTRKTSAWGGAPIPPRKTLICVTRCSKVTFEIFGRLGSPISEIMGSFWVPQRDFSRFLEYLRTLNSRN